MPVACMCAYTIVEPTKEKPRRFRSWLSASDSFVAAGTCFSVFQPFTIGRPPTNCQT